MRKKFSLGIKFIITITFTLIISFTFVTGATYLFLKMQLKTVTQKKLFQYTSFLTKELNLIAVNKKTIHRSAHLDNMISIIQQDPLIYKIIIWNKSKNKPIMYYDREKTSARKLSTAIYPLRTARQQYGWLEFGYSTSLLVNEMFPTILSIYLLLLLVNVILITGILYHLIQRLINRPINTLIRSIESTEKGIYRWDNLPKSPDILGRLGDKFGSILSTLAETQDMLSILLQVMKTLTAKWNIDEILATVLELIQTRFGLLSCSVMLLGDDGWIRVRNYRGLSQEYIRKLRIRPNNDSLINRTMNLMKAVVVDDTTQEQDTLFGEDILQEQVLSLILLPLIVSGKSIGVININARTKKYFTEQKVYALSALAEYLSIAIRNAQLYERMEEFNRRLENEVTATTRELTQTNTRLISRVRQLHVLYDLAIATSTKMDVDEVLFLVMDKMKNLLEVSYSGVFLYDTHTQKLVLQKNSCGLTSDQIIPYSLNLIQPGVFTQVYQEQENLVVDSTNYSQYNFMGLEAIIPVSSLLILPLKVGERKLGLFFVINKKTGTFTQEDVRVGSILTGRIAELIENIKLYHEIEQRLHDMNVLQEIAQTISSQPVLEQTLIKIGLIVTKSFNIDYCTFLLYDEELGELTVHPALYQTKEEEIEGKNLKIDDTRYLSCRAFREGKPFYTNSLSSLPEKPLISTELNSVMILPLSVEERPIGVMRLASRENNFFNSDKLRLATLIADNAAVIVENARIHRRLRDANLELERLNRVKNEFISVVSHELRTPLTALKGFVSILLAEEAGTLNEQQRRFLIIVDTSIERLSMLISDLLDISRMESGQMRIEPINISVSDVILHSIENISTQAREKSLIVTVKPIPPNLPQIYADRYRLGQVLDNLLSNAIKFTPAGGKIIVTATERGEFVLVSVQDNGIGIDRKEHHKIFEKFYQVDPSLTRQVGGTGLGLAIAKSIIDLHGGSIWLESELGKGTNFQFVIPRSKLKSIPTKKEKV